MKKAMCILSVVIACSGILWSQDYELRILTENYPPLSFMEDGVISGYGADVVTAIQKMLGTGFPVELMIWEKAYEEALNSPNLLLFTMERTPQREELFQFVGPLGANTAWFYVRQDNNLLLKDLEAAKQLTAIATTSTWFTEQHLINLKFENLISVGDPIETMRLVIDGTVDAAVFTDLTFPQLAKEAGIVPEELYPALELMRTEYYLAFSAQTDPAIVKAWSDAFQKLQESGELHTIKVRWAIP